MGLFLLNGRRVPSSASPREGTRGRCEEQVLARGTGQTTNQPRNLREFCIPPPTTRRTPGLRGNVPGGVIALDTCFFRVLEVILGIMGVYVFVGFLATGERRGVVRRRV